MKNTLIICLLLIGFSFQAQAQRGHKKENRKEMREKMKDLTPEQRADLKTKRMALDLDLTPAQQLEVKKLNLEIATKREAKMKEKKSQGEMSSNEVYEKASERLEEKIAMKKKFQSILSEEQFAKFEKTQKRMAKRKRQHSQRKKR